MPQPMLKPGCCIHDVPKETCAICYIPPDPNEWLIIRTHASRARQDISFTQLRRTARRVHISGLPYLWAVRRILEKAPHLKEIRLLPSTRAKLGAEQKALLARRGVKIVVGRLTETKTVTQSPLLTSSHKEGQAFFSSLNSEGRERWLEAKRFGLDEVSMATMYFGMNGEKRLTRMEISKKLECSASAVLYRIHGLMHYLSPAFETSEAGIRHAEVIVRQIEALREAEVKCTPLALQRLWENDRLAHDLLLDRLGQRDGKPKTFRELAQIHSRDRETVRQKVNYAAGFLGLSSNGI